MKKTFLLFFLFPLILFAQNSDSLAGVLKEAQLSNKPEAIADAAAKLGLIFETAGDDDSAVYYYRIAWQNEKVAVKKGMIGSHLSRNLLFSDREKSRDFALQTTALLKDTMIREKMVALNALGIYYSQSGVYDSSLMFYNRALEIATTLKDDEYLNKLNGNLGDLYSYKGEYSKALEYQFKCLTYNETHKDSALIIRNIVNIGNTYNYMDEDRTALTYYLKVYPLIKDQPSRLTGNLFNSMAVAYSDLKDTVKEMEFFMKSLDVKRALSDSLGMMKTLLDLGTVAFDRKDYDGALKFFRESLVIAEKIDNRKGIRDAALNTGDVYEAKKNYAEAIANYKLALQMSEEDDDLGEQRVSLAKLHDVYAKAGNFEEAYNYLLKYQGIYDRMNTKETAKQKAEAEAKYQNQKAEREKQALAYQSIINLIGQERAKQRQAITIIVSVSLLLLISLVFFFVIRNARIRARAREEQAVLASEQRERIRISRDLHDNVGTQLSLISNNIEWLNRPLKPVTEEEKSKRLQSIGNTAKEVITTLRETIWALNNEEISFEEFADKLKAFVQRQAQLGYTLNPEFHEELRTNVVLGPSEALGLFRICQEAATNAIKYSGSDKLAITLYSDAEKYKVTIADSGKGFDPTKVDSAKHLGVENMRHRATEIGCRLTLETAPGKGTMISLEKKMKDAVPA